MTHFFSLRPPIFFFFFFIFKDGLSACVYLSFCQGCFCLSVCKPTLALTIGIWKSSVTKLYFENFQGTLFIHTNSKRDADFDYYAFSTSEKPFTNV